MATRTERITIIVSADGTRTVTREITEVGDTSRRAATGVSSLRSALMALGAVGIGAAFIQYADSATQFNNALTTAGLSGQTFLAVQDSLYQSAVDNGQAANGLAGLYNKLSVNADALGISMKDAATFTGQIASVMRTSTSSTQAQAGAMQQLGQLFGGVKVQAQEWNSLVDGAFPLLQAAAAGTDKWGGSLGKMQQAVKASQVTTKEFVGYLAAGLPKIAEMADKIPLTIGQSFTALNAAVQKWVGTSETAAEATSYLSGTVLFFAKNMDIVMPILVAFTGAMAIAFVGTTITSAATNIIALGKALLAFNAYLLANEMRWYANAKAVAVATVAWVAANSFIIVLVAALAVLAISIASVWDSIYNGGAAWDFFKAKATEAVSYVTGEFDKIGKLTNGNLTIDVDAAGAADNIKKKMKEGGEDGGDEIKKRMKEAAVENAAITKATTAAGVQAYNNSFGAGANKVQSGIETGGATAADLQKAALEAAGNAMAADLGATGQNIYDLWNKWGDAFIGSFGSIGKSIGDMLIAHERSQVELMKAQAALAEAQARLLNEQAAQLHFWGSDPGSGGGTSTGSSTSTSSGGGGSDDGGSSFTGYGGNDDWQHTGLLFGDGDLGNPKDVRDRVRNRGGYNPKPPIPDRRTDQRTRNFPDDRASAPVIINAITPEMITKAMSSAEGRRVIRNNIDADRDYISKSLGL